MPSKFNIIKKGYDPAEVDPYINELETVVNSYKEKDASIKNAILSAQVAGDTIINEAKLKADEIVSGAVKIVDEITQKVAGQRKVVDNFKADYSELTKKYITSVNEADFEEIYTKIRDLEQYYSEVSVKADDVSTGNEE